MTNRISPRIVLHGFYGAGNLGDEAILAGILRGIRNHLGPFEAWVVSASPEATERLHGVRAIDRHDLHGIADLLGNAHTLLFGGGGLCNDYWSTRASDVLDDAWGSLAYYLRLPLLAGIMDVPVEILGQGVGPLNDLEARRQVGHVFSNAAHLNVRDPESATLLRELGVRGEIEVSPDPAFLLDPDTERGREALADSGVAVGKVPLIGLSVRRFPSLSHAMLENLVDGVGRFASDIGGRVVLLPFSRTSSSDDLALCKDLAKIIGDSAAVVTDEVTPAAMAGLFEHLDMAVAIRLHASIFALAASVPVVPIVYDRKVSSFASQAGLTCLMTSSVDADSVRARLHREWESREVSRSNLSVVAAEWRTAAEKAMDGLCNRLETARDRMVDDPGRVVSSSWSPGEPQKSVRTRFEEANSKLEKTWAELAAENMKRGEVEAELAEAKRQGDDLQGRLGESEQKAAKTEAELAAENMKRGEVEAELAQVTSKLGESCRELDTTREKLLTIETDLTAANRGLQNKLDFVRQERSEVAENLQEIWDSPYWKLLNRIMASRWVRIGWRITPSRVKRAIKRRIESSPQVGANRGAAEIVLAAREVTVAGPSADVSEPGIAIPAKRTKARVYADLEFYLERVDQSEAKNLVVFVAGVKYVANEGQRVTQIVREFIGHGVPVLMLYFRWRSEYDDEVPESKNPLLFQLPLDFFETRERSVIAFPFREDLRRTCVFEFPYPPTFQWVNEFNLAGWHTVFDILDDWEEFHSLGQAVWYEPGVEKYLCGNAGAVAVVAPSLAEKVGAWVPWRPIHVVPNGVTPEVFDRTCSKESLNCGEITVGYFGYLAQAWFDWALVADAARRRPTWRFHIIGYGEEAPIDLPANVELLGKVPQRLLFGYTQNWDVGIVPFKQGGLSLGADPIKVYEYLALGLPVVATGIPHLGAYPGVEVAESTGDFLSLIEDAARHGLPLDEVEAFVDRSTWYRRGMDLLDLPQEQGAASLMGVGAPVDTSR